MVDFAGNVQRPNNGYWGGIWDSKRAGELVLYYGIIEFRGHV